VEALTSGPGSDLAMEASYTPQLSYGYYSPYIASILDIARIMDSFHIAQYQYIPALASQQGDKIALTLNTGAVLSQSAIGPGDRPSGGGTAAIAALACGESEGNLLCRRSSLVLPVDGRAARLLDRLCARCDAESDRKGWQGH